jgi:DNA-directed RNA polymerase specialized sigma24 family protein
MYKIVMNTSIDKQREITKRRSSGLNEQAQLSILAIEDALGKKLENDNLAFLIESITDQLPEKQKLVFILRDMQELSSAEV